MATLSTVADVLSIVGFVLTVWTLRAVLRLQSQRVRLVRLPDLLAQLVGVSVEVRDALDPFDRERAREALRKACVHLESAEQKLAPEARLRVAHRRHAILERASVAPNPTRDDLFEARVVLSDAIDALDDIVKTLSLESP